MLPDKGKLVALDVGMKRIGIALCDESRFIATPKLILHRKNNKTDFEKIRDFINDNQAVAIVIGVPFGMEEMSKFIKDFSTKLDWFLEEKISIFFCDESLSSFEAREFHYSRLSRKKDKFVDDIAASLILQRFIDCHSQGTN